MAFTKDDLKKFQSESLDQKMDRSFSKIGEWFSRWSGKVYVSFSGGKDSTVLADLCARWCTVVGKTLYLLFVDTGLEFPEIRKHVKFFAQWLRDKYDIEVVLDIVRPEMRFYEVIKKYGYPIISKQIANKIHYAKKNIADGNFDTMRVKAILGNLTKGDGEKSFFCCEKYAPLLDVDFDISSICCDITKKNPAKEYEERTGRKPIIATMAVESLSRKNEWLKDGCNAFDGKNPKSKPMSFWLEQDVLTYIKRYKIPICSVYGDIIYEIFPEQLRIEDFGLNDCGTDMLCTTGCDRTGCIFCGFGCTQEDEPRFLRLKKTHPRQYEYCIGGGEYNESGKWQPNKKGLGMGHVFDTLNNIFGDDFIKYK